MTNTYFCNQCKDDLLEFSSLKDLQEHIRLVHIAARNTLPPATKVETSNNLPIANVPITPPDPPPKRPIVLRYKYEGQCTSCGAEVTTLDVVLDKNMVVVAYCIPCNQKLKEKQVTPISE